MGVKASYLSRRRFAGLLAAVPAASCLGIRGAAWAAPLPDFESQLREALAGLRLPGRPARFDLVHLERDAGQTESREGNRDGISAVVRMTWAPGTRQYRFTSADSADVGPLVAAIRARFGAITAGTRPAGSGAPQRQA
jgi:hypothetical protein